MEITEALAEALIDEPQSTEPEATAEKVTEVSEDTTPEAEETKTAENEVNAEPDSISENTDPVFVPIRFNHESKNLSIDEAATYAQKGMAAEPIMSKLRYLSAVLEVPVNQVVDKLLNSNEEARKNELLEKVNGDEELANQLLEAEKSKHQKAVDEMLAAEKLTEEQEKTSVNDRLANDFLELQNEFPEISSVDKIPKGVLKESVDKNISLLDSYLRYQNRENKKISAAAAVQKAAEKSTTGSIGSSQDIGTSPEIEAMLQGLWGR